MMSDVLPQLGTSADFGLDWPTWIAVGGFGLFCLLGCYATLLLVIGKNLPVNFRFLQLPTLRGRMLFGFVLAATLPAISLALVLSERTTNERLESTSRILRAQAETVATLADFFLHRYVDELTKVAASIQPGLGDPDADVVSEPMLRSHEVMTGVYLMMAADAAGNIIASTSRAGDDIVLSDVHGDATLTKDYFTRPLITGAPYISNGLSDANHNYPLSVAISVPVIGPDDVVAGVLTGYYDLSGLADAQSPLSAASDIRSVLLDRAGRVVFASANAGLYKNDVRDNNLMTPAVAEAVGPVFSFSKISRSTSQLERFLATTYPLDNGWQLYLYRPLDVIEGALLDEYAVTLAWLVGALLISICLALAIVHSLSGPLETLDESVRNFDLNLNQEVPRAPPDAPREVAAVFRHLRSLDKRLRATYRKLRTSVQQGEKLRGELIYVIANREKEIEQRTEELEEANQTLERLSREDSLTGLANRRWFAEFLARAWQSALRDKKPICILIIDIDNFKAFNDNYGHQKGDGCLKLVAEGIRRAVGRASDLVSRYGGEEFIVVLGDTPLEGGLKIAENIRAAVEKLGIPHKGAQVHRCVTVSIGVTSTLPTHDTQPETVLVAADRAMYNAKNDGKNKVAYSTSARTGTYQALCVSADADSRPS